MPFEDHEIVMWLVESLPPRRILTRELTDEKIQKVVGLTVGWSRERYPVTPARVQGTALIGVGLKCMRPPPRGVGDGPQ